MTKHCKTENTKTHHQDDRESDVRPAAALSALGAGALLMTSGCGGGSDSGTGSTVSGTNSAGKRLHTAQLDARQELLALFFIFS